MFVVPKCATEKSTLPDENRENVSSSANKNSRAQTDKSSQFKSVISEERLNWNLQTNHKRIVKFQNLSFWITGKKLALIFWSQNELPNWRSRKYWSTTRTETSTVSRAGREEQIVDEFLCVQSKLMHTYILFLFGGGFVCWEKAFRSKESWNLRPNKWPFRSFVGNACPGFVNSSLIEGMGHHKSPSYISIPFLAVFLKTHVPQTARQASQPSKQSWNHPNQQHFEAVSCGCPGPVVPNWSPKLNQLSSMFLQQDFALLIDCWFLRHHPIANGNIDTWCTETHITNVLPCNQWKRGCKANQTEWIYASPKEKLAVFPEPIRLINDPLIPKLQQWPNSLGFQGGGYYMKPARIDMTFTFIDFGRVPCQTEIDRGCLVGATWQHTQK